MANLPDVTNESFEKDVLQSDLPVLVDFSAAWCGPCKSLAPTVEQLAQEYDGKVRFFVLDVDAARETAARFGVLSVPVLMVFKNGQPVAQKLGNLPKAAIAEMIDAVLADTAVSS